MTNEIFCVVCYPDAPHTGPRCEHSMADVFVEHVRRTVPVRDVKAINSWEQRLANLKTLCEKATKDELTALHMTILTLMEFYKLASNTDAYLFYRSVETQIINMHRQREAEGKQNYRP